MKSIRKIIFVLILLGYRIGISQNLVPNPSFESYSSCPVGWSTLSLATGWYNPPGVTPDYFNACNGGIVGVPNNTMGYQPARTGVAYAGFRSAEPMQTTLICPLDSGETYFVSFYVNCADRTQKSVDNIGIHLTDSVKTVAQLNTISPQIYNPSFSFLDDTANWVEVSGNYTANGGEQYITISTFNPTNGNTHNPSATFNYSYYYIDDASVECITCQNIASSVDTSICQGDSIFLGGAYQTDSGTYYDTIPNPDTSACAAPIIIETILSIEADYTCSPKPYIPNAFSPNGDGFQDEFNINIQGTSEVILSIYDLLGEKVFEGYGKTNIVWDGTVNNTIATMGVYVYYLEATLNDGTSLNIKGNITLLK